jgi:hypothetical protein
MSTIDQRTAEIIIANDGYYGEDRRASKVVRYDNQWGGQSWAVVYPRENQLKYEQSPACREVVVLWSAK